MDEKVNSRRSCRRPTYHLACAVDEGELDSESLGASLTRMALRQEEHVLLARISREANGNPELPESGQTSDVDRAFLPLGEFLSKVSSGFVYHPLTYA